MAYYSLPKIKKPTPQVPTRVEGNRQKFSDTLQQRQGFIDQRKQEIQTGYVLSKLLAEPPRVGGLPPAMMPPVPNQSGLGMLPFGMQPQRLPGFQSFAEGGEWDTGGETEEERLAREAREAAEAGAAAGRFAGAGYMGGLGAFAPPPALPGAPLYGPAQPTYQENVQAMVQKMPEAVQIAAGEAQANNVEANLAQMRDYLPGNEKGPWYGPTTSPAQGLEGVRKELGPGLAQEAAASLADRLPSLNPLDMPANIAFGGPVAPLFGMPVPHPGQQGVPSLGEQIGSEGFFTPAAQAGNRVLGNIGGAYGQLLDTISQNPVGAAGVRASAPGMDLLNKLGITNNEEVFRTVGESTLPRTYGEAALFLGGAAGTKGPVEAVFNLPGFDTAINRGLSGAASRLALPAVRAGLREAVVGGERGAVQFSRESANAEGVYNALRRDIGLVEDPAKRLADQVRSGNMTAEDALIAGQRMAQGAGVRGLGELPPPPPGNPPPLPARGMPEDLGPVIPRTPGGPQSFFGDQPLAPMPPPPPPPPAQSFHPAEQAFDLEQMGPPYQRPLINDPNAQPWIQDLQRQLLQSSEGVRNPRTLPMGPEMLQLPQYTPPAPMQALQQGVRNLPPVMPAGPGPAGEVQGLFSGPQGLQLPERTLTQGPGLPDVMPMGGRTQPDVEGAFNYPTDTQGNRLGASGLPESNSERISRWMQEAQDLVEPKPLPIEARVPEGPPAREPLPSERFASGFTPPPAQELPDPGKLRLNDPEKFAVAQRWMGDQANAPVGDLSPQQLSDRLYHAGLESLQANNKDGTFTPAQLKALNDRYTYADARGIKLPGEEPPSGMPDQGDLLRGNGNVRQLSLDEAEKQAARLGVDFDRQAIERGTQLTKDQEWAKLQQATDDFLERERIAASPAGKAAEADYMQQLKGEVEAPDPKAAPVAPPGGFPKEANTSDLQRAYNAIAYAAYWSLGGDWGTLLRQDVMSSLNIFNVPQSLEAINQTRQMTNHAAAERVLSGMDGRVKDALERAGLGDAKLNIHRPEVPGLRAGDAATTMASRELTQTPGLTKIPILGKFYDVTQTMNAGLLYNRRSLEAERFLDNLGDRRFVIGFGNQRNSPEAKAAVAQSYFNQVAVMGGRASLGPWEDLLSKAGPLFTSLRFMMSIPEHIPYLLPVNRIAAGHWEIMGPQWREAVRQHAGFGLALAGSLGAASVAGAEVNPKDQYGNPQYGSFKIHGRTVDLTGGQGKYWGAVRDGINGDWDRVAAFFRNKTGPIPEDLFMAIQATGLDKATGTEDFFNYMRPEFFDRGFTGGASRDIPLGLNWNTADRLAALVGPLWVASTVKSYLSSQKSGDSPFESAAVAAGTGVSEFFGASTKGGGVGALTQLRTNVKGDEALDPTIRDVPYEKLGPKGKEEVNKLAEATQPEEYKTARKEADERNPVFAQHREQSQKITDEANQRKTDLYERFRNGEISGKQMMDGRKVANSAAQGKREEAQNNKDYKKAIDDLPDQEGVNKALKIYNAMYDQNKGPDGKIDFEAVRAKQDEFIRYVGAHDRATANLLLYEVRPAEKANPLDRLIEVAQPTLSHYFGDLKGETIQKQNELRANPRDDALINLLGYAQKTQTPEAAQILQQMKATLPSGRDFVAADKAPVAAGGGRGNSAPVPAAAVSPAPVAARTSGLPAPTGARLPPVAAGEFNSDAASPQQRQNFIQAMKEPANAYSGATRIPPAVFAAMGASESNWGRAPSVFGIKGVGSAGGANLATHEVYGGQKVNINDQFAAYNNLDDAFNHFIDLTSHGRYANAWNNLQETGDWQGFLRGITAAGYATDKSWPDSIISLSRHIENTYGLR